MSIQEQFEAAVKVIENLPKNGHYQPSPEMMLLFYAYYNQATQGPCTLPKPPFWDVVSKGQWNAWTGLGQMPKEEAMKLYLEEIKKIIETMSFSPDVEQFLELSGPFYEYVKEEEETGIDINSNGMNALLGKYSGMNDERLKSLSTKALELSAQIETVEMLMVRDGDEIDDDDFHDESEKIDEKVVTEQGEEQHHQEKVQDNFFDDSENNSSDDLFEDTLDELVFRGSQISTASVDLHKIDEFQVQMESTVANLRRDVEQVLARITFIENLIVKSKNENPSNTKSWLPFSELSGMTTFLLVSWPFVAHVIISAIKYHSR